MADQTKIEWADSTFNPWIGCTKVSPACDNCYAENLMATRLHVVEWGAGKPRKRTSEDNWKNPVRWNKKPFYHCRECGWRGDSPGVVNDFPFCPVPKCAGALVYARRRVFCASLADVFDNEVPIEWLVDLLDLIRRTPNLSWLLLTKRIGNLHKLFGQAITYDVILGDSALADWLHGWLAGSPPSNVWLGITVVNQEEADRDIPKLLQVPAAIRFLSIEPMLGAIDLRLPSGANSAAPFPADFDSRTEKQRDEWFDMQARATYMARCCLVDWVIVGGESGDKARPMHPDWVRSLRDQCQAAGTPFLFKQWGEWGTEAVSLSTGEPVFRQFTDFQNWVNKASTWVRGGIGVDTLGRVCKIGRDMHRARDEGTFPVAILHKVGKHRAGNTLDGRKHLEWPA